MSGSEELTTAKEICDKLFFVKEEDSIDELIKLDLEASKGKEREVSFPQPRKKHNFPPSKIKVRKHGKII
jgi:hypothetical protein